MRAQREAASPGCWRGLTAIELGAGTGVVGVGLGDSFERRTKRVSLCGAGLPPLLESVAQRTLINALTPLSHPLIAVAQYSQAGMLLAAAGARVVSLSTWAWGRSIDRLASWPSLALST